MSLASLTTASASTTATTTMTFHSTSTSAPTPSSDSTRGSCDPSVERLPRQLKVELAAIITFINQSRFNDGMTREIRALTQNCKDALSSGANIEKEYQKYIQGLQELLRDPWTRAPLDAQSWLGSDGRTYGKSLLVWQLSMPEPLRSRSPLDPTSSSSFSTSPHRVVRHMVNWLNDHDALLFSQELEQTLSQLLPQQSSRGPLLSEGQIQAERRSNEVDELYQQLTSQFQAFREDVTRQVSSLRVSDISTLSSATARLEESSRAFQERACQISQQRQERLQSMSDVLDRIAAQPTNLQTEVHLFSHGSEESRARLVSSTEEHRFEQLVENVHRFNIDTLQSIEEMAMRDAESMAQYELRVTQITEQIAKIREDNQELERKLKTASEQLSEVEKEEIILQQKIKETQIAIKEMEKNDLVSFISTIAITIGCGIATWGASLLLQSTAISITAAPAVRGASITVSAAI